MTDGATITALLSVFCAGFAAGAFVMSRIAAYIVRRQPRTSE